MRWLLEYGRDTIETIGVIAGLGFTAASYCADARERRVSNLMELANSHRDLWMQLTEKPELARVLKPEVDLSINKISVAEERYVHLLITHLAVTFEAIKNKVLPSLAGLEKDIQEFFGLPIPAQVWQWSKEFQQPDFVAFIEAAVAKAASSAV